MRDKDTKQFPSNDHDDWFIIPSSGAAVNLSKIGDIL